MADPTHLEIVRHGATAWNHWRSQDENAMLVPDLSGANLEGKGDLCGANFRHTNLTAATLDRASIAEADFRRSNLSGASLCKAAAPGANFRESNLRNAKLREGWFYCASFQEADLTGAELQGADLRLTTFVDSNLSSTMLDNCHVFGSSVWRCDLSGASQHDLVITPDKNESITVDSLDVSQFIYLLLNNKNIRHVIDTITSKVVLILGRFSPERKAILDAIREELRKRDYLPVLFDFEKPSNRDITETVSTLAHMARFVIADITDAKSIPQELMAIVPSLPSVPVQPLLLASQREYGMFEHFSRFPWVLEPHLYDDQDGLLAAITEKVIGPAEAKAKEQTGR